MDTYCNSHRQASAKEADEAAAHAKFEKAKKYVILNKGIYILLHIIIIHQL